MTKKAENSNIPLQPSLDIAGVSGMLCNYQYNCTCKEGNKCNAKTQCSWQSYNKIIEDSNIKSNWNIRTCFEKLRFDEKSHLGLGDITLSISQQEEICDLVEKFYNYR